MSPDKGRLREELQAARAFTLHVLEGLTDGIARTSFHPELSPLGWHLGHVAWQQEIWVLRRLAGRPPIDPGLDSVYDSFRGEKSSRSRRLPELGDIHAYARRVGEAVLDVLERADLEGDDPLLGDGYVFRFLANHERQHTETMGVVALLGRLPILPYGSGPAAGGVQAEAGSSWLSVPAGPFVQGGDDPDGWDNERAAHRVALPAFSIATNLVDNGSWLTFLEEGGYRNERLWSEDGWRWLKQTGVTAPLHWEEGRDGGWMRWTFRGLVPVDSRHPVAHVSWYEAEAFARWAGARLPTESEWERMAGWDGDRGERWRWPFPGAFGDPAPANLGLRVGDTSACGAFPGRSPVGAADAAGNVWEWCQSTFEPYVGFVPDPYRGYSEPWFDGRHRVLRGGSWLSWPTMGRVGFRNWFEPHVRWFPSGLRLAKD